MLTPSNKPNQQCIVELNSLKGECYPLQKTMKSVKWKSTPASPNPRANPGSSSTSIPSYPRSIVNMGSSKFTWPRQRAWWGLDQEGEFVKTGQDITVKIH